MYFQPRVVYKEVGANRENSIVRYIGNRVLRNNKNFLCALTGQTGAGKSWAGLKIAEIYSKMFGIPFNPEIHVISSLKEILELIVNRDRDKTTMDGSIILFDEPQVEANARNWQSEVNKALNTLVSTFRNQRLIVLFALPNLDMIDKQSRILFHAEFKILGYDKNTKITSINPLFLEWSSYKEDFYRHRLIVNYKVLDKKAFRSYKLGLWSIPVASPEIVKIYEEKKKIFSDNLNRTLLNSIELKEKEVTGKNKNTDLMKIKELYEKYGRDYLKISNEMPHMNPLTIQRYIQLIISSSKVSENATP